MVCRNCDILHSEKSRRHFFKTMRSIFILFFTFIITAGHAQQHDVYNGGLEAWHGGYFVHDSAHQHGVQCCGAALAVPTEWTIPEQIMQMPNNTFIFKEKDTAFIHSGSFSVRMYTNTTTIDSAGNACGQYRCAGARHCGMRGHSELWRHGHQRRSVQDHRTLYRRAICRYTYGTQFLHEVLS
jgi:hypothetical protein